MLRDLASVIEDLHRGVQAAAERAGMRIKQAEMVLPVDTALVLQGGGCRLHADVARSLSDAGWHEAPSRLVLTWAETPTEDVL